MQLDAIQANELAGMILVESLVQHGVEEVVLSPGSRSTPLAYACAVDGRLHTSVVLDERSAGFFALGKAKALGKPVVLLCTSGTAAANYLPAVVEARYSHTPLLVLTTDRPLTGQHCHSGQTILQQGIYANFCKHAQQLELPKATPSYVRYLRETLREAIWQTQFPHPGVVHLNVPFEEPLAPVMDADAQAAAKADLAAAFFATVTPFEPSGTPVPPDASFNHPATTCMWVLGSGLAWTDADAFASLLRELEDLRIPVCIDGLHPARSLLDAGSAGIRCYEWIFQSVLKSQAKPGEDWKPGLIFQWGNLPTSKHMREWLHHCDTPRVVVQHGGETDHRDPTFLRTLARMSPESALAWCRQQLPEEPAQQRCFEAWNQWERSARSHIDRSCANGDWRESVLCRNLPDLLPGTCDLFIANSMIVRDVENFFPGSAKVQRIVSNRGANGIDGLLSSALGATRPGVPLIALIGDLSFFHDAGGLNLVRQLRPGSHTVFLLLDNEGGGIFEHLPIAKREEVFERVFATPQRVDVNALCQAYGVDYESCSTLDETKSALAAVFNTDPETATAHCLHLRFDRKLSVQFRKSAFAALQLAEVTIETSL